MADNLVLHLIRNVVIIFYKLIVIQMYVFSIHSFNRKIDIGPLLPKPAIWRKHHTVIAISFYDFGAGPAPVDDGVEDFVGLVHHVDYLGLLLQYPVLHHLAINLEPLVVVREAVIQILSDLQLCLEGIELILKIILFLHVRVHITDIGFVLVHELIIFS